MKRDSKGRFIAERKAAVLSRIVCNYWYDCTDKETNKCATCANRLKKSHYTPETPNIYIRHWVKSFRIPPPLL